MTEISISLSGITGVDWPRWQRLAIDELVQNVRKTFSGTIIGTPDEVMAHLRAYVDVGLDELMLHWSVPGDIEGLRLLAEYVLPHFAG